MSTETHAQSYICPGETHSISRSVHLARLASFFPSCRQCPFRSDTGQLPARTIERLQQTERRVERRTLFTPEGVRGIYLNELNRKKATEITAAFASLLWEMSPPTGETSELSNPKFSNPELANPELSNPELSNPELSNPELSNPELANPELSNPELSNPELVNPELVNPKLVNPKLAGTPPSVVVAYDPRPSSPDIVTGVIAALQRMGCSVTDVGPATKPCLWFTVNRVRASAGLFVGGAGWPPAWTGLDFIGPQAVPLSQSPTTDLDGSRDTTDSASRGRISLNQLENRSLKPVLRSTRSSGVTRTAAAFDSYEASLRKHFHALRPLRIVLGCSTRLITRTVSRMLDGLPCELISVQIPLRARNLREAEDPDIRRIHSAVIQQGTHLGILIDDDGLRCAFLDEQGRLISTADVTRILSSVLSDSETEAESVTETGTITGTETQTITGTERDTETEMVTETETGTGTKRESGTNTVATVVINGDDAAELRTDLEAAGFRVVLAGPTFADISKTMREQGAIFAGGSSGRYWFRDPFPTCDAILTLTKILAALSQTDARFSEVVARCPSAVSRDL